MTRQYLAAVAAVALATMGGGAVFGRAHAADVVMLYLLASVLVSMRTAYGPSVLAALLSVLAFDVFFIPPYFSFGVTDVRHLGTFAILFIVAMTINSLTIRVRAQALAAELREKRTGALYAMSRDLARTTDAQECAAVAARHVRAVFGEHASLEPGATPQLADPDDRQLFEAFGAQLAVALERSRLEEARQSARTETMREQLKNTLLSSVSHDLRTPLTTVIGASSALLAQPTLSEDARRELLESIRDEALRLDRLVRNLLAMTRLEAGSIAIRRELQPLEEVVGVVLNRLEERARGRSVVTALPADLPPVEVDGTLVDQLLTNLLENALRYTPESSPIEIRASVDGDRVQVQVVDHGAGIPLDQRQRVFDKFQRLAGDRVPGGVGLGLAICRAIVEAHGGRIHVEDVTGGGAAFVFTLPTEAAG